MCLICKFKEMLKTNHERKLELIQNDKAGYFKMVGQVSIVGYILIMVILVFIGFTNLSPYFVKTHIELEGSCNTGFIGLDASQHFKTEYYPITFKGDLPSYRTIDLPDYIKIKNVDGLNCNIKMKGDIPLKLMEQGTI